MTWLKSKIKGLLPKTDNHLLEGLRFGLLNFIILLAVGSISFVIFWLVYKIRSMGIPLPLPVWLVLLGTGIPCFIIWFQYGKVFGSLIKERRLIRGLTLGILGNIPGVVLLYILVNNIYARLINPEIYRIILIMLLMFLLAMPIMVGLGTLDQKS